MIDLSKIKVQENDVIILWFQLGDWTLEEVKEAVSFTQEQLKYHFPNTEVIPICKDFITEISIMEQEKFIKEIAFKNQEYEICSYETSNNLY